MNDITKELDIIIVNYNTRELLLECLESIFKNYINNYNLEIYVVDNASTDHSVEAVCYRYHSIKVLPQKENLGFAKANNLALRQSQSNYVLLLNPDTVIIDNCLDIMLDFMKDNQDVGAVGCKVMLPDGRLDKACKRGFPTPANSFWYLAGCSKLFPKSKLFGGYHLNYLNENEVHEVDSLVGAFMLIRREALDEIGLLDEDFFMYGEDIDLCYRLKKAGWKIIYNPKAQITHFKGASSSITTKSQNLNKKIKKKVIYEFHRAMILFYEKHYRNKYNRIIRLLVTSGIYTKLGYEYLKNNFKHFNN